MDVQHLVGFTAEVPVEYKISVIHLATRMKYSEIHPEATTQRMAEVISHARQRLPPFFIVWTDNAMYFTMRYAFHSKRKTAFEKHLATHQIAHALIPPGQPWCNGFIERSNRTDNDECFHQRHFHSSEERRYYFRLWENFYNDLLPHQSLNLSTPAQHFATHYSAHFAFRRPALS
jgi:transposase InsO family protein